MKRNNFNKGKILNFILGVFIFTVILSAGWLAGVPSASAYVWCGYFETENVGCQPGLTGTFTIDHYLPISEPPECEGWDDYHDLCTSCDPVCNGDQCGQDDTCGGSCSAADINTPGMCGNPVACNWSCADAPYTNPQTGNTCGVYVQCSTTIDCGSCTPVCSGGQTWNGSSCACGGVQIWDGSSCVNPPPPEDGVCGGSHYDCNSGPSVPGADNSVSWDWTCLGLNGGYDDSCSEPKPVASGTLTSASPSCVIPRGGSNCSINFSWSVSNPYVPNGSAVTSSTNNSGTTSSNFQVGTGDFGNNVPFTVPYLNGGVHAVRSFFLYNNGVLLNSKSVSSDCNPALDVWDIATSKCIAKPLSPIITTFSSNKYSMNPSDSATLTWSSSNTTSCNSTTFFTGGATSGSAVVTPGVTTTYTLTCTGNSQTVSQSLTITLGSGSIKNPREREN